MASTVLPIALPDELRRRIEKLAARDEKLTSVFVESVLREALDYDQEVTASVGRGLADVEGGRTMTTEELMERVERRLSSLPEKQ
jgi:predicted transcriptional regulator